MPNSRAPYIDWDQWRPLLGQESDRAIALKIGCSRSGVTMMRQSLAIPPLAKPGWNSQKWTRQTIAKLGKETDEAIARAMKINVITVSRKRRQLGIAPLYPEADNRAKVTEARPSKFRRHVSAAMRRALRAGLNADQIQYIFGPLMRRKSN